MTIQNLVKTNDFPIKVVEPVHDGKVRSVYWTSRDQGIMIISDRISAFDAVWGNVANKGSALNHISSYLFRKLSENGMNHHLLEQAHPLVWRVQRANPPVMVEAISRAYIVGSMWRAYEKGDRVFCGQELPEGLREGDKLEELIYTPTSKGILSHIERKAGRLLHGFEKERESGAFYEKDDCPITPEQILRNYQAFGFESPEDVDRIASLNQRAYDDVFNVAYKKAGLGDLLDFKLELGYLDGKLSFIDEPPTPDSGRLSDNRSKEFFRQGLIRLFGSDLTKMTKEEVIAFANDNSSRVPEKLFGDTSKIYMNIATQLTGTKPRVSQNPRQEIMDVLSDLGVLK